jgi:flagellar assembly protein FliH
MANIINAEKDQKGKVEKFSFNRLDVQEEDIVAFEKNPFIKEREEEILDHEEKPHTQKASETEERRELMEKIDQLTSDVVRLQMELEKAQKTHEEALEAAREEAYERGRQEAIETFQNEQSEEFEALKSQFIRSITLLDEQKHIFDQSLQELETELLESAFLIARKVILKEVDKHSSEIAAEVAKFLLKNIKESSDVTLKVNPEDFAFVSSQLKESLIKIESDEAIQKGGVVILGSEENIDGNIFTRYKQALQFLQKES